METDIFSKMRVKPKMKARVLYAPEGYPSGEGALDPSAKEEPADFVHLFVSSRQELEIRLPEALEYLGTGTLFWISYPKASGKNRPDINRDSLWDASIPYGIHPVSQVSLDETWSAVRFSLNEPGKVYVRPGKKKNVE